MRVHGGDILSYEAQFHKKPLDFSVNVSPLGLPAGVRQAVIDALDDSGQYPDTGCRALRQALREYHGIPKEWILCGNGAADLIDRLATVLAGSAGRTDRQQILQQPDKDKDNHAPKKVLLTAPTFTEYRFALERVGLQCDSYPLKPENEFAIKEDILERITPGLTAVLLCEPNNPTGKTTDRKLLIRILEKCKACGVMLIIDECFQEFLDDPDAHTMQRYLVDPASDTGKKSGMDNPLLILKSFTKTYAMAGIRLGYCLCADQDLLAKMEQAAQPWAVSGLAQAAGIAALKETAYLQEIQTQNRTERERMKTALKDAGCRHVQGEANYILFWHERTDLAKCLAKKGILLRTCTDYEGLDAHWYRVGVLGKEDNDRLIEALASERR